MPSKTATKPKPAKKPAARSGKRRWFGWLIRFGALLLVFVYGWLLVALLGLKLIDPPTTAVQIQRRIESWSSNTKYQKRYRFVPLDRISQNMQHAAIAAEDGRFFQHSGFDWKEIQDAVFDDLEDGRVRGASTITQQLAKNLFLTTRGSIFRKAAEAAIVPMMEMVLSKQRILELYLNVIEFGPGIYGVEAASQHYYRIPASQLNRDQASRLAAVLPSPRRRTPARMDGYSATIRERMSRMGW